MNNEKKHLRLCIALCIAAVILGAAMFFFEMYLSYFSTANKLMTLKWNETKVLVISISEKPEKEVGRLISFPYIGKVTYLTRYNYSAYNSRIVGGGKGSEAAVFAEAKAGNTLDAYYKPDDPERVEFIIPKLTYIVIIAVIYVIAAGLTAWARAVSVSVTSVRPPVQGSRRGLRVSYMDIPAVLTIALCLICFFSGMAAGSVRAANRYSVDDNAAAVYSNSHLADP